VSYGNARQNYRVRADPHVILNDNRSGRLRQFSSFDAVFVSIDDAQVMTKQTVAPDADVLICCNRCAVVDERMISNRNTRAFVGYNFDWRHVPYQGDSISKLHVTTWSEINSTKKSHGQGHPGFAAHADLSVEKCCS
jgi:hypothetical protein